MYYILQGERINYTIRQTTNDDLPQILELIKEFHVESLEKYGINCNEAVAKKLMPKLVKTSLVLVVNDKIVGVIAGMLTTHIVDDKPLFQEVLWFVSKQYRRYGIKLLERMKEWCRQNGVVHFVMVNLGGDKNDQFKRFYEKQGFELLETQYILTL